MKIRQSNEQTEHGITNNKAAWLTKANRPLGVRDAPMPTPKRAGCAERSHSNEQGINIRHIHEMVRALYVKDVNSDMIISYHI